MQTSAKMDEMLLMLQNSIRARQAIVGISGEYIYVNGRWQCLKYIKCITPDEKTEKSYKSLTETFSAHCVSKQNAVFERMHSFSRNQEPGELHWWIPL